MADIKKKKMVFLDNSPKIILQWSKFISSNVDNQKNGDQKKKFAVYVLLRSKIRLTFFWVSNNMKSMEKPLEYVNYTLNALFPKFE